MSDKKALSRDRFNQFAEGYVNSPTHAKGDDLTTLVDLAQPQPDWHVLDIATGGGHTARTFAPFVADVVASDIAENMLAAAKSHILEQGITNVSFEEADAEKLPFEANQFDLVTCRIAPHHFPKAGQFVKEAARVLKPGGLLLIEDQVVPDDVESAQFINDFETLRDPSHYRVYTQAEWQTMYEEAGLTVTHTETLAKRKAFYPWCQTQDTTPEIVQQLETKLETGPAGAREWYQPQDFGEDQMTIQHRYIIIAGRKPA
ncbi:methyltransferase domain-containing protein [Phototrophicus methaneseepsis]|uniref:Methyltransferase domain-containing protein n=1 Tax=Phototrophicus methaneseepsis TaxID=2710758 RepID=A0A7S8E573_9CHLR|nr:methyltransferase domain-containing protein [Phototrophicus methaneseepsis]QPC80572.1 methyltransferase domain-containing protein [Phototrophicus methaneseepsis]